MHSESMTQRTKLGSIRMSHALPSQMDIALSNPTNAPFAVQLSDLKGQIMGVPNSNNRGAFGSKGQKSLAPIPIENVDSIQENYRPIQTSDHRFNQRRHQQKSLKIKDFSEMDIGRDEHKVVQSSSVNIDTVTSPSQKGSQAHEKFTFLSRRKDWDTDRGVRRS